jgi:uncharacterized membrane protein
MTRERFAVGVALIGLIVLTVALFITSLASVDTVRIDSFQRSADPQKIIVNVTIGLGDEIAERTVKEDARSVIVTVRTRRMLGPKVSLGIPIPVVVSLKQPLEGRVVLDYDGRPVRDLGIYFAPGSTPAP